jgi:hypothetical protein
VESNIGEIRNKYKILIGKPKMKTLIGDLSISGKIILEWILTNMLEGMYWIHLLQGRLAACFCGPCNERLGFIRCGENFLE